MDLIDERRMGTGRLRIFGFSCVHYGDSDGHDVALWKTFLKKVHRTDNAVVFGLGDYTDWSRTTHRVSLKSAWGEDDKALSQHDTFLMEEVVWPFVRSVQQHCPSFKQKCVVLVEGNHFGTMLSTRFTNGHTTTQEICRLLEVRYGGLLTGVRMMCYRSVGSRKLGTGHILNVLLNHSVSSSGELPASLSSAERRIKRWSDVDIFLSGNDHQLGAMPIPNQKWPRRGKLRLIDYERIVGKVGSFQRGYVEGTTNPYNYVEKKMLHPSKLGWLEFDAWIHSRSLRGESREVAGVSNTAEVWRFGNFSYGGDDEDRAGCRSEVSRLS